MAKTLSNKKVWSLYKNRCVVCRHLGDHVHEIIPKSQTKDWQMWDNRVILCAMHHENIHKFGASSFVTFLKNRQETILTAYYGKGYSDRITGILRDLH